MGRPKGTRNKLPSVQIRHELERVYLRMGGFDSLYQYASSEEGKPKFYEWFVKIFAAYELKETTTTTEPIRVLVYGPTGQCTEMLGPPAQTDTPPGIDNGPECST